VVTRYTALATALNPNIVLLCIVHSLAGRFPGCAYRIARASRCHMTRRVSDRALRRGVLRRM